VSLMTGEVDQTAYRRVVYVQMRLLRVSDMNLNQQSFWANVFVRLWWQASEEDQRRFEKYDFLSSCRYLCSCLLKYFCVL